MALVLRRNDGETWLEAALRVAKKWGLEGEVQDDYDAARETGCSEGEAAWNACADWDILAWEPDEETARRIEKREAG